MLWVAPALLCVIGSFILVRLKEEAKLGGESCNKMPYILTDILNYMRREVE